MLQCQTAKAVVYELTTAYVCKKALQLSFSMEVLNRDTAVSVWSLFCRIIVNRTQGLRDFNCPLDQCSMK